MACVRRDLAAGDSAYHYTGLTIRLCEIAWAAWVPVWFMMRPPRYRTRAELLTEDDHGVKHVRSREWVKRDDGWMPKLLVELVLILLLDWIPTPWLQDPAKAIAEQWHATVGLWS
jgi:hypothetical protein